MFATHFFAESRQAFPMTKINFRIFNKTKGEEINNFVTFA